METDRIHQPGLVPAADMIEFEMFLCWLAGHAEKNFKGRNIGIMEPTAHEQLKTASSDVWAVAMVLDHLGISLHAVKKTGLFR